MSIIAIPRQITKGEELVVMSKSNYEKLLMTRLIPEYQPTATEKSIDSSEEESARRQLSHS